MKKQLSGVVLLAFINIYASAQSNYELYPSVKKAEIIYVNDEKPSIDEVIELPAISSEIQIFNLPMPEGYDGNTAQRVFLDSDRLFVRFPRKMLVYNTNGELLFELGKKSECPESLDDSNHITVYSDKKEIWVYYINPSRFYVYSYSGDLIRIEEGNSIIMRDFVITRKGMATYVGGLKYSDSKSKDKILSNELNIHEKDKTLHYFKNPNADGHRLSYGGTFGFSEVSDSYTFHFLGSDTIYSISKKNQSVSAKYMIDFGNNGMNINYRTLPNSDVNNVMMETGMKTGYVEAVCESDDLLYFTYRFANGLRQKSVFYNTADHKISFRGILNLAIVNIANEFIGLSDNKMCFLIHKYNPNSKIIEGAVKGIKFSDESRNVFTSAKPNDLVLLIATLK